MRIATHPEAIKHLVKIGMAADISEHIKMVESANESLIEENARLKAEVERLKEDNRQLTKAFEIAEGIIKRMGKAAEDAAKEGKQP